MSKRGLFTSSENPPFGFSSSQQQTASSSLFGASQSSSSTPSVFGSPGTSSQEGLFSSQGNMTQKTTETKSTFGFPSTSTSGQLFGSSSQQSAGGSFQSTSAGLFSQKTETTKLFAPQEPAQKPSFSFKQPAASKQQLQSGLFLSTGQNQTSEFNKTTQGSQQDFSTSSSDWKPQKLFADSPNTSGVVNFGATSSQQFQEKRQQNISVRPVLERLGRKRSLDDSEGKDGSDKTDDNAQATTRHLDGNKPLKRIAHGPTPGLFSRTITGAGIKISHQTTPQQNVPTRSVAAPMMKTPIRRKSSVNPLSPTEAALIPTLSALNCTKIPDQFNNKEKLRKYFSRFGKVKLVRPNPAKKTAFIQFFTHEAAANAKKRGKKIFGPAHEICLYFYKRRGQSTDKMEEEFSPPGLPVEVVTRNEEAGKKLMFQKKSLERTGSVRQRKYLPDKTSVKNSGSFYARTDSEKLQLLEKIDKILRSRIVKESNLSKAKVAMGTCPDMCPEKERYLRLHRNLLASYEMDPGKKLNHQLAVKEYSRSSADQEEALSHELRPSPVLRITMDYLLTHVMNRIDSERIADWYDFLWNRTRAIRKEISIQQANDPLAVEVAEECARFHICCGHELCEEDRLNFDPKINNENLEKAMKTVLDMYNDVRSKHDLINESEFLAYHILLNINKSSDVLRELQNMSHAIRESQDIRLAVAAFSAVHSNNYSRFFSVLQHASYLQAAILHRYFEQVRKQAILTMARAYSTAKSAAVLPVEHVIKVLHLNDIDEMTLLCNDHMIPINNGFIELSRSESYDTEDGVTVMKSCEIAAKMHGRNLGEIIAHNREPSHEIHKPVSSFDENGRYIGPHVALLNMDPAAEVKKEPPAKDRAVATAPRSVEQQDLSSTSVELHRKGITDVDIKTVAVYLFREVIEEMVQNLSNEVIQATHQVTATNKVVSDLLSEVVTEQVRNISQTVFIEEKVELEDKIARKEKAAREAEQKAKEEAKLVEMEKARLKAEQQRRKEKMESLVRCARQLDDEIQGEVVMEMVTNIARDQFREARLNFLSDIITDDITNSTTHEELMSLVKSVVKNARKSKLEAIKKQLHTRISIINFQRWQKSLTNLRRQRHARETFPSAPYNRNIDDQITDLLHVDHMGALDVERCRFPIDKMHHCELTMESAPRLLEKHEEVVRDLRDTTRQNVAMRIAAMSEELLLTDLYHNNFVKSTMCATQSVPSDGVSNYWWKICIGFLQNSSERCSIQWLKKKFGCLNESSALNSKTYFHENKIPCKVTTCVEIINIAGRHKILGSTSLVFVLTENDSLSQAKDHLQTIVSSKPSFPPVSLLLVVFGQVGNIPSELGLEDLKQQNLIMEFKVLFITDHYSFTENNKKLEEGVRWLASSSQPPPSIHFNFLSEILEEQISYNYITPMCRHLAQREKVGLPHMQANDVIETYNGLLSSVCDVLTNQELLKVSWPPHEMIEADERVPSKLAITWNTQQQFDRISFILSSIQLPNFPAVHMTDSADSLQEVITEYCENVCPNNPALLSAVNNNLKQIFSNIIQHSYMSATQLTFVEQLPWQKIIDAVASTRFETVTYKRHIGDLVVGYSPSDMDLVKIPKQQSQMFSQTEFLAISTEQEENERQQLSRVDLSQTLHSVTEGSACNLSKIISQTSQNIDTVKVPKWSGSNSALETLQEASELKQEIRLEKLESQRFENRLKELLNDGGVSNYSFDAGDLSLLFS